MVRHNQLHKSDYFLSIIRSIKHNNGKMTVNSIKIANYPNKSFANVAENVSKNIPKIPQPNDYLDNRKENLIFPLPVTNLEVVDEIHELD